LDKYLKPFTFEGQKDTKDLGLPWSAPFPAALRATNIKSIPEAISTIQTLTQTGRLRTLAKHHAGAILIRGLPIKTPHDYSAVAHAFGLQPHTEVGRPPLRTVLAPNVKTANEGPPELPIWSHNEYGWSTINPAWLTFCALRVPERGGATPITSSIYIAHRLEQVAPWFLEDLRRLGAMYTYRYTTETLVSNTGNSIRGAYGEHVTDDDDEETFKRKVEAEVRRHSERFEWHEDGSLSVTHVVPGQFSSGSMMYRVENH
jgi:alpha-ketoglutarate-dependent taurine dioxygenase